MFRDGLVAALATFATAWTLLEPMGGFEPLERLPRTALDYLLLALFSVLFGVLAAPRRAGLMREQETSEVADLNHPVATDLVDFCSRATRRIDAVGLTFPTFASERMLRVLRPLLLGGVEVRVLVVNPFSQQLQLRPRRLYLGHVGPNETAASTLRTLTNFRNSLDGETKQRLFLGVIEAMPTIAYIRVDSAAIWHPYLEIETGVTSGFFSLKVGESYFDLLNAHFSAQWAEAHLPDPLSAKELASRSRQTASGIRLDNQTVNELRRIVKEDMTDAG